MNWRICWAARASISNSVSGTSRKTAWWSAWTTAAIAVTAKGVDWAEQEEASERLRADRLLPAAPER